ncbi:uncharacterized protein LACBIDRAFT_322065 [Laccaria bicolor S238N-H82]|uniref:Predicted protein n=1 Tax=Laccaria bicolor (strain S238N-H82 / ATCC MYA-4686) TaxID=486041 RepID=B0CS05_LACBS|nr:uncharacterized protein LACBIDRAFT_322065 [Laccaria bicolor S238N-H82]EDR14771.1 predicted protein [Laccaria bicolor S238N-H82]|eukprot:XP_001875330.1 predicted protein [Laccaria bicolor S238N-H82]
MATEDGNQYNEMVVNKGEGGQVSIKGVLGFQSLTGGWVAFTVECDTETEGVGGENGEMLPVVADMESIITDDVGLGNDSHTVPGPPLATISSACNVVFRWKLFHETGFARPVRHLGQVEGK